MKYINIVSDIIDIRQNPTARYAIAEKMPKDCDILHFVNNSSRAGHTLHTYICDTWKEAQELADELNNESKSYKGVTI